MVNWYLLSAHLWKLASVQAFKERKVRRLGVRKHYSLEVEPRMPKVLQLSSLTIKDPKATPLACSIESHYTCYQATSCLPYQSKCHYLLPIELVLSSQINWYLRLSKTSGLPEHGHKVVHRSKGEQCPEEKIVKLRIFFTSLYRSNTKQDLT